MEKRSIGLILLGCLVGFLSSALGIGGGAFIVPILVICFGYKIKEAAGTSLLMIAPAAGIGLLIHLLAGSSLQPSLTAILILSSLIGVTLGSRIAEKAQNRILTWLFTAVLVFTGLLMIGIFSMPLNIEASYGSIAMLGLLCGVLSGLFGIGGGMIIVPALSLSFGMAMLQAITTSLAVIIPTALWGAFSRKECNLRDIALLLPGTFVGAIAGALVASQASPSYLKAFFGVLLIVMAGLLVKKH